MPAAARSELCSSVSARLFLVLHTYKYHTDDNVNTYAAIYEGKKCSYKHFIDIFNILRI